jgi:integrase
MHPDYKITREKFFNTTERKAIMRTCEDLAIVDRAKGRQTWQVRYMLVHLAMYSGLRVSEIANLRIGHIHLTSKPPSLYVLNGKGGRSRDVYIDKELVKHIREYIQLKRDLDQPINEDSPFFTARNNELMSTTALNISFKNAVRTARLRDDLSIHSARHTYATLLYYKTKNMKYVQKQLGHASLTMTSLYADVMPEQNGELANMILNE